MKKCHKISKGALQDLAPYAIIGFLVLTALIFFVVWVVTIGKPMEKANQYCTALSKSKQLVLYSHDRRSCDFVDANGKVTKQAIPSGAFKQ